MLNETYCLLRVACDVFQSILDALWCTYIGCTGGVTFDELFGTSLYIQTNLYHNTELFVFVNNKMLSK